MKEKYTESPIVKREAVIKPSRREIDETREEIKNFTLEETAKILATARKKIKYLKTENDNVREKAGIDGLTGLLNRDGLVNRFKELADTLNRGAKDADQAGVNNYSILWADVVGLKQTNENIGFAEGDKKIITAGGILKAAVHRSMDLVGRIGGDDMVIVTINTSPEGEMEIIKNIQKLTDEKNSQTEKAWQRTGLTMGIVHFDKEDNFENALIQTGNTMVQAKHLREKDEKGRVKGLGVVYFFGNNDKR